MNRLVITACSIIKLLINAILSLSALSLLAFSPNALHHKRQSFILLHRPHQITHPNILRKLQKLTTHDDQKINKATLPESTFRFAILHNPMVRLEFHKHWNNSNM